MRYTIYDSSKTVIMSAVSNTKDSDLFERILCDMGKVLGTNLIWMFHPDNIRCPIPFLSLPSGSRDERTHFADAMYRLYVSISNATEIRCRVNGKYYAIKLEDECEGADNLSNVPDEDRVGNESLSTRLFSTIRTEF